MKDKGKFSVGDVIWLKIDGGVWWPVQIVNEKIAGGHGKSGEVPVRLYGSYEFMYVNPAKTSAAFENVLKKTKGNYKQIFEKSLEQSISGSMCKESKGEDPKPKGTKPARNRSPEQERVRKSPRIQSSNSKKLSPGDTEVTSARKMRVMKSLGLTAPSGSPFKRK